MTKKVRSQLAVWRLAAVDALPFLHPVWVLAAVIVRVLAFVPPLRPRLATTALWIHRNARSRAARDLVEPLVIATHVPLIVTTSPVRTTKKDRLLILKPYVGPNEKGVLKVMFSEMLRVLPSMPRFDEMIAKYTLVLEPSWTGVSEPGVLQYAHLPSDVAILTGAESDYLFLQRLGSALKPVRIGPCDWVDPRSAEPFLHQPKTYDLVMNSSWAAWKRHHALFRALAEIDRPVSVALVGVAWDGGSRDQILALADGYGVRDRLTVFEAIPYEEVMRVTCASRAAILLSLKEGSNRSLAEAMFCDVPVILLDSHWGGIAKNVVAETGILCDEPSLPRVIEEIARANGRFTPRAWAMKNISCTVTTARLNAFLKDLALARGEQWTTDIAVHSNSPECNYYDRASTGRLAEEGARLWTDRG